ncbi:MAG: hypothetical protein [Bacteriophage sp.]|nr:MAG: hypothetical protein [Bacteriophage sp.]
MEIWKDVKGFEGKYWVSNKGNVRGYYSYDGLKGRDVNGYLQICLSHKGKRHERRVHRLVAEAFLGLDIESDVVVNHKDEDKSNNNVENLECVSSLYNRLYSMVKLLSQEELELFIKHLNDNNSQ